jgi:hypothetical protein
MGEGRGEGILKHFEYLETELRRIGCVAATIDSKKFINGFRNLPGLKLNP